MYYDMSGFDYGILDVVQVLHLRKRRGNYYDCPFCGETHGKLWKRMYSGATAVMRPGGC